MKFYCDTDKLNSALGLVSKAVESNSISPHMQGVLLKAQGGVLNLKGSNTEICIETSIPSNVAEEGEIVINCKMLCDIARKLPKDVVEFALNEKNNVSVSCLNSDYTIIGLPAGEYPEFPQAQTDKKIEVSSALLKEMINKTIFAVSTNPDEVRKVLKGTLFEISNNSLTLVSVDLYRLAMVTKEITSCDEESIKFIVPGKTLNDMKGMLSDDEERKVKIYVSENQALFDCGGFKLTTRLIDGEFFSYKQIIPKQFKNTLTVDSNSFIKTVERVEPIIENISKNPIRLTFTDGKIKIKCETQIGKINDFVDCDYNEDEMVIGFNYRYIHDALIRCDDEKIELKFNSPFNPVILGSPEDESYLFMVLPVRL